MNADEFKAFAFVSVKSERRIAVGSCYGRALVLQCGAVGPTHLQYKKIKHPYSTQILAEIPSDHGDRFVAPTAFYSFD